MTTYVNPPKKCDLCSTEIETEFSDCSIPRASGRWGNICQKCAVAEGVSYGTGLGQLYRLADDGKFHKVKG